MIRRPPRSTQSRSSAASDVYKRQRLASDDPGFSALPAELLGGGSDKQLQYISPIERFLREDADVSIRIMAQANTRGASRIDPERTAVFSRARADLSRSFMERAACGDV